MCCCKSNSPSIQPVAFSDERPWTLALALIVALIDCDNDSANNGDLDADRGLLLHI